MIGAPRLRLLIVSSVGGHLREVLELVPAFGQAELRFILNDRVPVELPGPVATITHAERDLRVAWNLVEVAAILHRWGQGLRPWRPDVVLSTGAGPAVPAALVARALGARVLYVETFAAVERPSLTGRLMAPLADHFLVQWPTLLRHFPAARYAGSVFRPPAEGTAPADPDGSLLVAVGTSARPFDRLLRAVDQLYAEGALDLPGLVQRGPGGYVPRHLPSAPLLPAPELDERIRRARLIVCHAGAGLLGTCLRHGKRPVVLPRLGSQGEHVDDHQLMLSRALGEAGLIRPVPEASALGRVITQALAGGDPATAARLPPSTLHAELTTLLQQIARERGRQV